MRRGNFLMLVTCEHRNVQYKLKTQDTVLHTMEYNVDFNQSHQSPSKKSSYLHDGYSRPRVSISGSSPRHTSSSTGFPDRQTNPFFLLAAARILVTYTGILLRSGRKGATEGRQRGRERERRQERRREAQMYISDLDWRRSNGLSLWP